MTRTLRSALVLVALAVSAPPLTGCAITNNNDGSTTLQNLTRFDGTEAVAPVPKYAAGDSAAIVSHNGNVTVVPGADEGFTVSFKPFTMDKGDQGTRAASEMANNLTFNATKNGSLITVEAVIKPGASGLLGADIKVTLPKSFSGAFGVTSTNGQVDADLGGSTAASATSVNAANGTVTVANAHGKLAVDAGNGGVTVDVGLWATDDGTITASNGDIDLKVPTASNGWIGATASGIVTASSVPPAWKEAVAAANSKSYTMGTGVGGKVTVAAKFGDVTIEAK